MEITKTKILGSNYVGLFGICNDTICFLPEQTDKKTEDTIAKTLDVKTIKISLYQSSLLAVFAKINNKYAYIPSFASPKEIEKIEKEIKTKIINTENALGNLIEINDTGAIISKTMNKKTVEEIKKSGLQTEQTNIGKTEVVGSAIIATKKAFLINPNATNEEINKVQKTLGVKGGSSTANFGDPFVRNSILANTKGIVIGEATTPHEINRIEEALSVEQKNN